MKTLNDKQKAALEQVRSWMPEGGYWLHKKNIDGRILRTLKRYGYVKVEETDDGFNITIAEQDGAHH